MSLWRRLVSLQSGHGATIVIIAESMAEITPLELSFATAGLLKISCAAYLLSMTPKNFLRYDNRGGRTWLK